MYTYRSLALSLFLACSTLQTANATTIDGNVSDWFSNSSAGYSSWVPTANVDKWTNHDGQYVTIFPTADNRPYDIEMGALDVTDHGLYILLVLTNPNVWEDIAIAVNGSATHEYGIDLSGINNTMGVVQNRGVYEVSSWQTSHSVYNGLPDFNILAGSFLGSAQFIMSSLGIRDDGFTDYALEGYLAWNTLGIEIDSVCTQFSEISCLRDSVNLCTEVPYDTVPEPSSLLLIGSSILGLKFRRRLLKTAAI